MLPCLVLVDLVLVVYSCAPVAVSSSECEQDSEEHGQEVDAQVVSLLSKLKLPIWLKLME